MIMNVLGVYVCECVLVLLFLLLFFSFTHIHIHTLIQPTYPYITPQVSSTLEAHCSLTWLQYTHTYTHTCEVL